MDKGFAVVGIALALFSNAAVSTATEFAQSKTVAVSGAATTISPQVNCSGYPLVISQPGSYVLSGSMTLSCAADAIDVKADNVVIDLSGQTITGAGSGTGIGINGPTHSNITVKNGSVVKMGGGGINLGASATIEEVTASSNGTASGSGFGILLINGIIHHVHADNNLGRVVSGFGQGIISTSQTAVSEVSDSEASNNSADGIVAHGNISRNAVNGNGRAGIRAEAPGNTVIGNVVESNGLEGIAAKGTISNNAVHFNGSVGIEGDGLISGNSVDGNGQNGNANSGQGILVTDPAVSVVGNTISGNLSYGIDTANSLFYTYGNNSLTENNGAPFPSPTTQVHGGVQMGPNTCDGFPCP